jgi:hypothetical protein
VGTWSGTSPTKKLSGEVETLEETWQFEKGGTFRRVIDIARGATATQEGTYRVVDGNTLELGATVGGEKLAWKMTLTPDTLVIAHPTKPEPGAVGVGTSTLRRAKDSPKAIGPKPAAEVQGEFPVEVSGWAVDQPTVAVGPKQFDDKSVELQRDFGRKPYRVVPRPGHRLVVVECRLKAVTEDAGAVEALSKARKEAFATISDGALKHLRGDGAIGPETRKEWLPGAYRLFSMERFALTDSGGKTHLPVWCPAPAGGLTVIYDRGRDEDHTEHWQLMDGEKYPKVGKLAVRTNANRGLKTAGRFLRLVEVGQAETVTLLFEVPTDVRLDGLRVVVEGGTPVTVKVKN